MVAQVTGGPRSTCDPCQQVTQVTGGPGQHVTPVTCALVIGWLSGTGVTGHLKKV